MSKRILKYNEWLTQNLFWVVIISWGSIGVIIGLLGFGIWNGNEQRAEIKDNQYKMLTNDSVAEGQRQVISDSVNIKWEKSYSELPLA